MPAQGGEAACWSDWGRGAYTSTRSASARLNLEALRPHMLAAAQASGNGGEILGGFDTLVRQLSVGAHLFASLVANPDALQTLLQLVTRAPRLAQTIANRPDVFEALIEDELSAEAMSQGDIVRRLTEFTSGSENDDELLRRVQLFTRKYQFLISARAVLGWMPVEMAERAFSKLAVVAVQALAGLAERKFQRLHGRAPGCDWALVALGKFGGYELTATSDLDMMLVYDTGGEAPTSNGPRPLPATQYFNQLAKSIIAILGTPDIDGALFEVDFRLRPWGNKGPIATQLSTLKGYLEGESWTYEHMAMTRAQAVIGPAGFSATIESVIRSALERQVDERKLRSDILEMHILVHATKETKNPWHIKEVRGGLIDVEFIAQYLMLRHARTHPAVVHTTTADALHQLNAANLLATADFKVLSDALSFYKALQQATRIACPPGPLPESIPNALAAQLPAMVGEEGLSAIEAKLRRLQKAVCVTFKRLLKS